MRMLSGLLLGQKWKSGPSCVEFVALALPSQRRDPYFTYIFWNGVFTGSLTRPYFSYCYHSPFGEPWCLPRLLCGDRPHMLLAPALL